LLPCLLLTLLGDVAHFLWLCLRPPAALAAENLFLRKQLALYQAHHVKPRRATDAIRVALVWLSQWFDWQPALAVVQPETFRRWRRQGVGLFWYWQPKAGRPPIPAELQRLIRQMVRDNLT
jgi:putative transposase